MNPSTYCAIILENQTTFHIMSKTGVKQTLSLALKEDYFIIINLLYQQVGGVSIGSPLVSTLANIFLYIIEKIWPNKCPVQFKLSYYRRYIDDTFAVFSDAFYTQLLLDYLTLSILGVVRFVHKIYSTPYL